MGRERAHYLLGGPNMMPVKAPTALEFEITYDPQVVREILTNKQCYLRMRNDEAPDAADFTIRDMSPFKAVLAREDGLTAGIFIIFPKDCVTGEIHFCLLPNTWGRTEWIAQNFVKWVWMNTHYKRLTGPVPGYNILARRLAEAAGFTEYDVQVGALTKHGREYNMILLEIRRPCV